MSSLTSIRSCTDRIEAESLRIRLAEAGIRALVTGTDMETALGLGGAGTMRMVRLEVPTEDAERAIAILEEDRRKALEAGPWICERCHEQNEATFEVCWSCNKQRTDSDQRGRRETTEPQTIPDEPLQVEVTEPTTEDGNPYRPAAVDSAPPKPNGELTEELRDTLQVEVRRAFRAAVIGSFIFPPLINFYSLYLLLALPPTAFQTPGLRGRVIMIAALDLVLIAGWTAWWLSFFR